jgi:Ca2+-binding EF-hand superfamily protein
MSAAEEEKEPATTTSAASAALQQQSGKTMQQRVDEMSEEHRTEIREAFNSVSKDGQAIESHELKFAMRALGFEPKKEEIRKIMSSMDKENSGKLTFEQFLIVMGRKFEEKGTREEIMKAFSLFDADNTGRITFENLKQVASELGESIDDQELREMISEADRDGDGGVDREEFFRIMRKTCLY